MEVSGARRAWPACSHTPACLRPTQGMPMQQCFCMHTPPCFAVTYKLKGVMLNCRRFKSVPAFTANLTMELFQRQTQC